MENSTRSQNFYKALLTQHKQDSTNTLCELLRAQHPNQLVNFIVANDELKDLIAIHEGLQDNVTVYTAVDVMGGKLNGTPPAKMFFENGAIEVLIENIRPKQELIVECENDEAIGEHLIALDNEILSLMKSKFALAKRTRDTMASQQPTHLSEVMIKQMAVTSFDNMLEHIQQDIDDQQELIDKSQIVQV